LRGWDEPCPTDYPGVVSGADDPGFDGAAGAQRHAADPTLDDYRVIETKYVPLQSG